MFPAGIKLIAARGGHGRLETMGDPKLAAQLLLVPPESGCQAGQVGRPQGRRLRRGRAFHGDTQDIRLELAEKIIAGGAAIHAQHLGSNAGVV